MPRDPEALTIEDGPVVSRQLASEYQALQHPDIQTQD